MERCGLALVLVVLVFLDLAQKGLHFLDHIRYSQPYVENLCHVALHCDNPIIERVQVYFINFVNIQFPEDSAQFVLVDVKPNFFCRPLELVPVNQAIHVLIILHKDLLNIVFNRDIHLSEENVSIDFIFFYFFIWKI